MLPGINTFKDSHKGEIAIVIGNGPSLKDVPLDFLKSYPSFGSNRIWRLFQPTFYVCSDPLDVEKNYEQILAMTTPKFIRRGWGVGYPIEVILKSKDRGWNQFTPDPTQPMYDGCTVSYVSLELAYWMGFTTVLMVGIDHRYVWKGERDQVQIADGNDPNHFMPNYHLPGEKWEPPNLKRMEAGYRLAREAYDEAGRRIINLTDGTALDVFEKMTIQEWSKNV